MRHALYVTILPCTVSVLMRHALYVTILPSFVSVLMRHFLCDDFPLYRFSSDDTWSILVSFQFWWDMVYMTTLPCIVSVLMRHALYVTTFPCIVSVLMRHGLSLYRFSSDETRSRFVSAVQGILHHRIPSPFIQSAAIENNPVLKLQRNLPRNTTRRLRSTKVKITEENSIAEQDWVKFPIDGASHVTLDTWKWS
jgi:hypothetical protein